MTIGSYVSSLYSAKQYKIEIDTILISMLMKLDLNIYYIDESTLIKRSFFFPNKENNKKKIVNLYLDEDGDLDVIYEKNYIKSCGMCQSIILDVYIY